MHLRWFIAGFLAGSLIIALAETEEFFKLFKDLRQFERREPERSQ
jgi:hypothetical protein